MSQIDTNRTIWTRVKPFIVPLITLGIFFAALWAIHHLLQDLSYERLVAELKAVHPARLGWVTIATVAGYLAMTGYDWFAIKYIGKNIPYRTVALASFCGYAIANTVGFSLVSGGSVRYRLYSASGLDGIDIVRITLFCALGFGFGVHVVGATALAVSPEVLVNFTGTSAESLRWFGIAVVAVIMVPVAGTFIRHAPIGWGKWKFMPPSGPVSLGVLGISMLDVAFMGIALYSFLPDGSISFIDFLVVFSIALFFGITSHVPGGLGVFEGVMLVGIGDAVPKEVLTAALILFRAMFYLVPLVVATVVLAIREFAAGAAPTWAVARRVLAWNAHVVPPVMAGVSFAGGLVLLVSAAIPPSAGRMPLIAETIPLAVVESAHFFSALVGFGLLVVASGLYQRLRKAYVASLALLITGCALSLAKGFDYEEASALLVMALLMATSDREFYRVAPLTHSAFTRTWLAAIVGSVGIMLFMTAFSFKNVEYQQPLWWQFDLASHLSRSLRAALGVIGGAAIFGFIRLSRPISLKPFTPTLEDLTTAHKIVENQDHPDAHLALMGDRRLFFSDSRDGFIMFSVFGSNWIAWGDPIGPADVREGLAWNFRDLVDRSSGRLVFYQTREDTLPIYLDMGLSPLKLGEEAIIKLDDFSLDVPERSALREALDESERDGLAFDVLDADQAHERFNDLAGVSSAWLSTRSSHEGTHALGVFDRHYLQFAKVATLSSAGRLIGFITFFAAGAGAEASVDLIRHVHDAPTRTVHVLLTRLILALKTRGVRRMTLGMVPLSDLENHPLAPLWHRFGNLIYNRGQRFRSFEDLRHLKEPFGPEWEPRYLVTAGGMSPLLVITDIARLIRGENHDETH